MKTKSNKIVNVLVDSNYLTQVSITTEMYSHWVSGQFRVSTRDVCECKIYLNGLPSKTNFIRECERPRIIVGSDRRFIKVSERINNFTFPFFEIAVNPSIDLDFTRDMCGIFSNKKSKLDFFGIRELLDGYANMMLAKEIHKKIDSVYEEGCKKVFVTYRVMPTCLPHKNTSRISCVAYAEMSMMGC